MLLFVKGNKQIQKERRDFLRNISPNQQTTVKTVSDDSFSLEFCLPHLHHHQSKQVSLSLFFSFLLDKLLNLPNAPNAYDGER